MEAINDVLKTIIGDLKVDSDLRYRLELICDFRLKEYVSKKEGIPFEELNNKDLNFYYEKYKDEIQEIINEK